jgi:hypothetical protein
VLPAHGKESQNADPLILTLDRDRSHCKMQKCWRIWLTVLHCTALAAARQYIINVDIRTAKLRVFLLLHVMSATACESAGSL